MSTPTNLLAWDTYYYSTHKRKEIRNYDTKYHPSLYTSPRLTLLLMQQIVQGVTAQERWGWGSSLPGVPPALNLSCVLPQEEHRECIYNHVYTHTAGNKGNRDRQTEHWHGTKSLILPTPVAEQCTGPSVRMHSYTHLYTSLQQLGQELCLPDSCP